MNKEVLGPPIGYVDMLNEETLAAARREVEETRKFHPLRPSAFGKCSRELYYELMEYSGRATYAKKPKTPDTMRLLDFGHHVERHLVHQFDKHLKGVVELRYKQQVLSFFRLEAKHDPKLSHLVEGSLDACFFSGDTRGVIDFKSKKDKYSSYFSSTWDESTDKLKRMTSVTTVSDHTFWVDDLESFLEELRDPFLEMNFMQLNGYANTSFLKERGINHGAIIQSNKNDSRLREIRFRPSDALYEKVRGKLQGVVNAVDEGNPSLAPRDHILGSLKCAFCDFATTCWQDADTRRAFYDTLPGKRWPTDTTRMAKPVARKLENLIVAFEDLASKETEYSAVEAEILKVLTDQNINKVRFENGHVYEVKFLKSPRPRFELRRSKA
jgi:phage tail protein X